MMRCTSKKLTRLLLIVVVVILCTAVLSACGDDSGVQQVSLVNLSVEGGYIGNDAQATTASVYTGVNVTVTAVVPQNHAFDYWTDGSGVELSRDNPYTLKLSGDTTLIAVIKNVTPRTIRVQGGYINGNTGQTNIVTPNGSTITLTANVADNMIFRRWVNDSDDTVVSTLNPYSYTVNSDASIRAVVEEKQQYTIAVSGGYIGVDQNNTSSQFYTGDSVKVSAVVPTGKVFEKWTDTSGNTLSTQAEYIFEVDGDIDLVAVFVLKKFMVSVTNGYIDDDTLCTTKQIEYDKSATVDAKNVTGEVFAYWKNAEGDNISSESHYVFKVTNDISLTAVYTKAQVSLSVSGGVITPGNVSQKDMDYGSEVTITATPAVGKEFVEWTIGGNQVSTDNPYTFQINANTIIIAQFKDEEVIPDPIMYSLSVINGKSDVLGTSVESGTTVTLTADEDTAVKQFLYWEVDGTQVTNIRTYSFVINGNTRAIAVFNVKVSVTVIDGDSIKEQGYDIGDTVTLTAQGTSSFIGWFDGNNKEVSKDITYAFVLKSNADITMRALYADKQQQDGKINVVVLGGKAYQAYDSSTKTYSGELGRDFMLDFTSITSFGIYVCPDEMPVDKQLSVSIKNTTTDRTYDYNKVINLYKGELNAYIVCTYTRIHSVTIEGGKDGNNQSGSLPYSDGQEITVTSDEVSGKMFECWEMDGEFYSNEKVITVVVNKAMSLKAVFSNLYTVTVQGGGVIKDTQNTSVTVKEGEYVTVTIADADTPEKAFKHWTNLGGGVLYVAREYTFKVGANTTVVAVFSYGYEVSVINGTIDGLGSGVFMQDTQHTIIADKIDGKRFKHWKINGVENTTYSSEALISIGTIALTIEAIYDLEWEVENTSADVILRYANAQVDKVSVLDGESIRLMAKKNAGYFFDAFVLSVNGQEDKIAESECESTVYNNEDYYLYIYIVNGNVSIDVAYSQIIKVTVKNANDDNQETIYEFREGDQLTLTAKTSDLKREFVRWTVGASRVTQNPYVYTVGSLDITITAEYVARYMLELENGIIESVQSDTSEYVGSTVGYFRYDVSVKIKANPGQGYRFAGWRLSDGTTISDLAESDTVKIRGDIKYIAELQKVYTVTYRDGMTNEILQTITVDAGKSASYSAPAKDNARFDHWSVNGDNVSSATTYTIDEVNADVVVKAEYVKTASITLDNIDGMGTKKSVQVVDVGSSFTVTRTTPSDITGTFTFLGWKINGELDTTANADNYDIESVTEDITLEPCYEMLYKQTENTGWATSITNIQSYSDYYTAGTASFVIPGLTPNENFVLQGIDYHEGYNWAILCGYISPENSFATNSMIFIIDMNEQCVASNGTKYYGKLVKEILVQTTAGNPYTGHAGGIAVTDKNIWVSNASRLYYIPIETVINAKQTAVIPFTGSVSVPVNSSYCTFVDGVMWVGEFEYGTDYPTDETHKSGSLTAWTVGYVLDETGTEGYNAVTGFKGTGSNPTPDYVLWHTEKIQGMTFAGNKIVLSQSYGRRNDAKIYIYKNEVYGSNKASADGNVTINNTSVPYWNLDSAVQTITAPSMTEDIASVYVPPSSSLSGGEYYVLIATESASHKYNGGESTVSKNPIDIVWRLRITQ